MEREVLKICPYVPTHRMPASRLQYHLVSCKKKNPNIAKKMASCKYNACHVVPIKRLKEHEANCVYRTTIDDEPVTLPKFISTTLELNDKLSSAASQIPDPIVWNTDNMNYSSPFVLKTFTPRILVCESDSRELRGEVMVNNNPNNNKR
ncbi:gametocyte-specific factor 1-like [Octodon degus]|uniref:Gametocyte-specific factor 1-like n=1 Tax=Octodon degus TaxID=10160 RepID=A0A6P3VC05_OCTDE|nr:gametocyte-specific factor 1-like [Octodon degus]